MSLTRHTTVSRTTDVLSTDVDDELVVIHLDSNAYYGFDSIGRRIWELIEQPRSIIDVCAALCEEFDVAPEECESDVLAFLEELASSSVVHAHDTAIQ